MRARFDDLRPAHRHAFGFEGLANEIVAHHLDEVVPALEAAERAARNGFWVAGYVAYEAAPAFDRFTVVDRRSTDVHRFLPLAWFGAFERRVAEPSWPAPGSYALGEWHPTVDREAYDDAVGRIRDHIRAGDTYQVNYSMRMRAPFSGDPLAFYRHLGEAQSGGYGAYLDAGRFRVLSASPELFFERRGSRVITQPMKGTIARGRFNAEDERQRQALLDSAKDRAENVMIVDLLRNDLGRVAEFGTVRVEALFEAERFDTVWQLTSTVTGSVGQEATVVDLFRALFPCGSVTGAPKMRTMEIIAQCEREPRGVYCGAIGFLAPSVDDEPPDASFSVAIRTVVVDMVEGEAEYGTGGGVTYDSSAEGEYQEAMVKAAVLTRSRASFRLLETIRWDPSDGYALLDGHISRLRDSAIYFGIDLETSVVEKALADAASGSEPLRIRLMVDRAGAIDVEAVPLGPPWTVVRLAVDDEPVDTTDPFLFHKTTHRSAYDVRRVRHPHADEVLLVNERGNVTEGTITNLLARIDGRWWTPPVTDGCLPGVGRAALVTSGSVGERSLTVAEIESAAALEVVNSVRGRVPAVLMKRTRR